MTDVDLLGSNGCTDVWTTVVGTNSSKINIGRL